MKLLKSGSFYLAVLLVILSALTDETEARRKILRGRKTITRTYYRSLGVPAWAIVVMSGFGMLIIGAILYVVMRKVVLSGSSNSLPITHTYAPAMQQDEV